MSNTFFTSDEHHGHRNALLGWGNVQAARPFGSLEEMTEGLIDRHNAVVKRGDKVYHNGDMFWRTFGAAAAVQVMKRLNGQHFYIYGNHDEVFSDSDLCEQFIWLRIREKISPDKTLAPHGIVLDHFAGRVWDGSHRGTYQLFGHSHGALDTYEPYLLSFDVGVDSNNYTPVSLEEVHKRMQQRIDAKAYQDALDKMHREHWLHRESITD